MNPQELVDDLRMELVALRIASGLNQSQLAERIGIQQAALSRLESGSYRASALTLVRWAYGLGREVALIPRGDGEQQ